MKEKLLFYIIIFPLLFAVNSGYATNKEHSSQTKTAQLSKQQVYEIIQKVVLPEYNNVPQSKDFYTINTSPKNVTMAILGGGHPGLPGYLIDYIIFEMLKLGLWVIIEGSWYTYDDVGRLADIVWKMFASKGWENSSMLHNTYDASNNLVMIEWYSWKDAKGWEMESKQTMQYDEHGNMIESLFEYWYVGGSSKSKSIYTYIPYNEKWLLENRYGFFWDDLTGQFENSSWTSHEYSNGLLDKKTYKYWSSTDWQNSGQYTYSYDSNDNLIDEYNNGWNTDRWEYYKWYHYSYVAVAKDGWYNEYTERFEWIENTWVPYEKTDYSYTEDWFIAEELYSKYVTKGWQYETGNFYSYYLSESTPYLENYFKVWDGAAKGQLAWRDSTKNTIYLHEPVSVTDQLIYPGEYSLSNYPNPFNPSTTIEFSLTQRETVTLVIYDVLGRIITTLIDNKEYNSGTYKIIWDGLDLEKKGVSSGLYFYQIKTDNFTKTNKCMLLK
ncbi:MAG: T9SS type A sorting domain-containing protein [bacterium]